VFLLIARKRPSSLLSLLVTVLSLDISVRANTPAFGVYVCGIRYGRTKTCTVLKRPVLTFKKFHAILYFY